MSKLFPRWGRTLGSSRNEDNLSLTIKSIAISLLPVIKNLFGVNIANEDVDAIIDAVWTLIFAVSAVYGYIRSKKVQWKDY